MPESHRVQRGRASKRQHGLLAVTVCLYGKVKSRVIQHTRKRGQVRREGFGQYGVVVTWRQTGDCRTPRACHPSRHPSAALDVRQTLSDCREHNGIMERRLSDRGSWR
jgi:hypothetical protein